MQLRLVVFASLLTLLALVESRQAQPDAGRNREPRNVMGAELDAINHCVREVRQARPGSAFDAHVGTLGTMRYVSSTDAEIAAFRRCMEMKGLPVVGK